VTDLVAPDYMARVDFLAVLTSLQASGAASSSIAVDDLLDRFDRLGQDELAGLLGAHMGATVLKQTGSLRQAAGYLNIACRSYRKSGSTGFAEHLVGRYPDICSSATPTPSILTGFIPILAKPANIARSRATASLPDSTSGISSGLDAMT